MKILIIEDEHRIGAAIQKGLRQETYTADMTHTGTEGYDLASTGDYDCILLDLMIPGMDGLTLCRELRKNGIHTPVLMLTAKSQVQDKVTGFYSGADDYLIKPFSFEELLARIRSLTRRPKQIAPDMLTVSGLTLDTRTFDVMRDTHRIRLSSKEFSLLEYLMRNPHKILTKNQIISRVWSYDSDILPNTVEVYIRNLRQKIDKPFPESRPLIQTVRGFGYKIG